MLVGVVGVFFFQCERLSELKQEKTERDKFSSFSCNECGESTALVNHLKILKCENTVMNFLT